MFSALPHIFLVVSLAAAAQPVNDDTGGEDDTAPPSEDCQEKALEFFLRDKEDFKKHCPYLRWDQPSLETYKEEPKSHLPAECKAEKI